MCLRNFHGVFCGGRAFIHWPISPMGQGFPHGALLTAPSRPFLSLLSHFHPHFNLAHGWVPRRFLWVSPWRESQKPPHRKWEDWGVRWDIIQGHLRASGWCLHRTGHCSCGWTKRWGQEDVKRYTTGVHYPRAFSQGDPRDWHTSCAVLPTSCSLVQPAAAWKRGLASLIYTNMPYRGAKALVFLTRCCIAD